MSSHEHATKRKELEEEEDQEWLKQPPIQFPLHLESPIQNLNSNIISSHVGDEGNDIDCYG
jgi:hypothetical protein